MKKNENGFIDFNTDDLDPIVGSAIEAGRERQARRKTPAQIRKAEDAKARKAEKDRERNRRMIDLPPDLEKRLEKLAADLSIPVSSLMVYFLAHGMETVDPDALREQRVTTRSMRYEYILPYKQGNKLGGCAKRLR